MFPFSPHQVSQLKAVCSIEITYNAHHSLYFCHTQIQALYLQAWIAAQLHWNFQSISTPNSSTLKLHYASCEVDLVAIEAAHLPPGLIMKMTLTTTDETLFVFERHDPLIHQVSFHLSTPTQCCLPSQYIFPKAEVGHSLVKEICHRGTSAHFLNTLTLIQHLCL